MNKETEIVLIVTIEGEDNTFIEQGENAYEAFMHALADAICEYRNKTVQELTADEINEFINHTIMRIEDTNVFRDTALDDLHDLIVQMNDSNLMEMLKQAKILVNAQ